MTSMRGLLDSVSRNLRSDLVEGVQDADVPLSGSLNPKVLGEMLPDVTDMRRFISAVMKVKRGDEESLSIAERGQLAMAFVSLLKGDRKQDAKIMRRLMMVQAKEA